MKTKLFNDGHSLTFNPIVAGEHVCHFPTGQNHKQMTGKSRLFSVT